MAVALVGGAGEVDGAGQRRVEGLETGAVLTFLRQIEELLLGFLDLGAGSLLHGGVIGDIDHVLANADQRTAQRQVVDRAAVVLGIDDGGRFRRQAGEISGKVDVADGEVGRQEGLDGDRGRHLVGADELAGDLEDRLVHRFEEMLRLEEIGNAVEGFVVDQDGAKQRLFRLNVLRRGAIGLVGRVVGDRANRECHCAFRPSASSVPESSPLRCLPVTLPAIQGNGSQPLRAR